MENKNFLVVFIIVIFFIISGCAAKSPLIKASSSGDSSTVQKLINEGANVNEPDGRGYTPLMHAIWSGNVETVQVLLNKGADVNAKDKDGCTPLFYAAKAGDYNLMKALINKGADVNLADKHKRTPLIMAIAYDNIDIIKLLVKSGADINSKDYSGNTALMWAYSPAIVEMLIDNGGNLKVRNDEGYTVLEDAINKKDIDKVLIIRKKTNWKEEEKESLTMYQALKTPSYYKPEKGMYDVPVGKELAYTAAVYDCNHLSITGKTGLLMAGGAVGYAAGMAFDAATVPRKFHACMEKMGFKCKNNCPK